MPIRRFSGGTCTLTSSALAAGTHAITARFPASARYAASVSGSLSQAVAPASTTTTVVSSNAASTYLAPVTFTVSVRGVNGTVPAGLVSLSDGGLAIGSCTLGSLTATSCTFSTAALTVGNHSLTAYYNGDANRAPSLSAVRTQTVNTVTTTTTLTSSANPVAYGTAITFTAVVSTPSATGTVSFSDGTSGDRKSTRLNSRHR